MKKPICSNADWLFFNIKVITLKIKLKTTKPAMIPIKKILIAIDYHHNDPKLARIGCALAKEMDAEIILYHTLDSVTHYTSLLKTPIKGISNYDHCAFYKQMISDSILDAVNYYLTKLKKHFRENSIQIHLETKADLTTIYKSALDLNTNFIVIGSHNTIGVHQVLMGNIHQQDLNHQQIPLLVVPTTKTFYSR